MSLSPSSSSDRELQISSSLNEHESILSLEIENPNNSKYLPSSPSSYSQILQTPEQKSSSYPSNFFSNLIFSWVYNVLKRAKTERLKEQTLGTISSSLSSELFFQNIKPKWDNIYRQYKKRALFHCLINANFCQILFLFFLKALEHLSELSIVFLFREIMLCFEENSSEKPFLQLKYLSLIMIVIKFLLAFIKRKGIFLANYLSGKTMIEINSLIYDKVLKSSLFNQQKFTEGELLNYLESDADKFGEFLTDSPGTFIFPFELCFYCYLLFCIMGPSFVVGFIGFGVIMFILGWIQRKMSFFKVASLKAKDERMKELAQILNIMKTIKLYGWEDVFMKRLQIKRDEEIKYIKDFQHSDIILNALFWSAEIIISVSSILTFNIFSHNKMQTTNVITAIYIINSLTIPLFWFPDLINELLNAFVSLERIEKFLFTEDSKKQIKQMDENSENAIEISNCSFGVLKEDSTEKTLLSNVNLVIKKGELIGIIGEVGSGKTCLLEALLDNLTLFSNSPNGKFQMCGRISYVNQNPWIINDTVRNNILFFKQMDFDKYQKILQICELNEDLTLFREGDLTEIGAKGANLSGGQKARIALARALYTDADIFILDDVLSSLDASVGMKIMNSVIKEYLKGKTRIFATHSFQYINSSDKVIYMKDGAIEWFDSTNQLKVQVFYNEFIKSLEAKNKEMDKDKIIEGREEYKKQEEETPQDTKFNEHEDSSILSIIKNEEIKRKTNFQLSLVFYSFAGGMFYLFALFILNILMEGSNLSLNWYISYLSKKHEDAHKNRILHLFFYSLIGIIGMIIILFRAIVMVKAIVTYNIRMHREMMLKILKAPLSLFHEIVPKGLIINRLSKDLENAAKLSTHYCFAFRTISQALGCIIVCAVCNKFTLLLIPIIVYIEYQVVKFYFPGGRDLNKLEVNTRSAPLSVLSETIPGVPIIRASNYEEKFKYKFYKKLDTFFKAKIFKAGANSWFGLILDLITLVMLIFVLSFGLIFKETISLEAMGFIIRYSLRLIEYLYQGFEKVSSFEHHMVSVELCDEYLYIPQERESTFNNKKEILKFGSVRFENFSAQYRPDTPIVLKNISFEIKQGEKIGIVGRTGSGKSTLLISILRIIEAESGRIFIGDIDISKISLSTLRKNVTIIPQDPVLFEGNLRDNVDPSNEYSDSEVKDALINAGLEDLMERNGKEFRIDENGNNLSIGEKQLVCIARAMLRKSKIVLLDEATANLDYTTELAIQEALYKVVKDAILMTIAHRIKTIKDYDRILVIDKGEIVEYDTPRNLLMNQKGMFFKLYKESEV